MRDLTSAGAGGSRLASVPDVVVQRMPLYNRELRRLVKMGNQVISSERLGELLRITPEQVRKDLSYFGRFGKQGRGLDVRKLAEVMEKQLGLDTTWNVLIMGLGRIGRAVVEYPGLSPEGFKIVAAFDNDENVIGKTVKDLTVLHPDKIPEAVAEMNIRVGIVAVPVDFAQASVNQLVKAGIRRY